MLLLFLCLFPIIQANTAFYANITSSSSRAGSTVQHFLSATFTNYTLSSGSYLRLAYNSAWSVSSASRASSGDFCESNCTLTSVSISVIGNAIRISNLFPNNITNNYFSIGISIQGIVNPRIALTDSLTLQLFTSGNSLISSTTITIAINPSLMTCSAVPSNTTVTASTSYLFTITPNPAVPLDSTGSLQLAFPAVWKNSQSGPALVYSSCSGSVGCSLSSNTITATNLFSGSTTSAFSFSVSNVINPGSTQQNTELTLSYKFSNGSIVSTCSVEISGLTATSIDNVLFSINNKNGNLQFSNIVPALITDELVLTFPNEYYLDDVQNIVMKINGSGINQYNLQPNKISGQNKLVLTSFKDNYLSSFSFTISNVYLLYPIQQAIFTIQFTRYGYTYSEYQYNYNLSAAQTLAPTVTISDTTMSTNTQYSITFSPNYYATHYFLIDLCTSFTLTTANQYPCYISLTLTSTALTCTAMNATQIRVQLANSSSFSSVFGFQSSYTLIIAGITNPSVTSCWLRLGSYMSPANELQFSGAVNLSFSTTTIIQASLTIANKTVGASSTYTFTVNNTNVLPANSQLYIFFPSTFNTTSAVGTFDNAPAAFNLSSTYIYIVIPTTMAQYELAAHTFEVSPVTNPNSLKPTPSFRLQLSSGGSILSSIGEGIVATMNTLANFTSLRITPGSNTTGETTSYVIDFIPGLTIANSSSIQLSFILPSQFTLISCSACNYYNSFNISNSDNSVTISQVINPDIISVASTIYISLEIDGYLAINDSLASPTFIPKPLTYQVLTNSSYLGEVANVNLSISNLPIGSKYLIVTVPAEYTIGTLNIYSPQTAVTFTTIGHTINSTLTSIASMNISLIIQGLINPVTTPSSAWHIQTYSSEYILVANGTSNQQFVATCGTVCRHCRNTSFCLNCYSNLLVNSLPLLDQATSTCVSACTSSQYQMNSICFTCNSSCLTCNITQNNCTSCQGSTYLLGGLCLTLCPDSYFISGNMCMVCVNNCKVCNSSAVCNSCSVGYILQSNNTCLNSCPEGYYNHSNVCSTCPNNCTTCDERGCTACVASNYLCQTASVVCLSQCPQGYYLSSNLSWCELCQSPCLRCFQSSTNCTACNASSSVAYLSGNTCISSCPNGTYADELNQCRACQSPCANCYSFTNCSSCQTNYSLYEPLGQCVSTCISNTINLNGTCEQCISPCLSCSGTTTTCTSCISSYFLLSNGTCTNSCLAPNKAYNGICSICLYPCISCNASNTTQCTACTSGYFIFSSTCYSSCPTHTYANTVNTCALCTPPCAECSGGPTTCTACYNSSYLYNNQCYNPCPVGFFVSGVSCVTCESQCTSCPYTNSNQCSSCSTSTDYYNPITYHCTANCSQPYYANQAAPLNCLLCELPCKTCSIYYTQCNSCYPGYFLYNQQCLPSCPGGYFENISNNTCIACPLLCSTCDGSSCLSCSGGNYFYAGGCYNPCPTGAPFIYGSNCRNCLVDNCMLCNSEGYCTYCQLGYLIYQGKCTSQCPGDYEPDTLTSTRCIKKALVAYSQYIEFMESMKVLAMPACLLLVLLAFLIPFAQIKLMAFGFMLSIPQTVSLIQFAVLYWHQWHNLNTQFIQLPQWLGWGLLALHGIITVFHIGFIWGQMLAGRKQVEKWLQYGANSCRFKAIVSASVLNKQVIYLLFSGLFKLPITSLPFPTPNKYFYITHTLYMLFQILACFLGISIAVLKQTKQYNEKLFYSSLDLLIIFLLSFGFDIIFAYLSNNIRAPTPYQKYVLPAVSNRTLPALSEPGEDAVEETNQKGLHRSGSDEDIFESQEMKDVDFRSAIDINDFYDDTPAVSDIEDALASGKFRKKNKKKRGMRRGAGNLDVIEEESFQSSDQDRKGKKNDKRQQKRLKKKQELGGLNNYIYYRKPKEKKPSPGLIFKQNEQVIMSRIRQKESEFDTITQNDIIFQEEQELDDSSLDDYEMQHESRRALNRPQTINYYDNLFNLNYAERDHMG